MKHFLDTSFQAPERFFREYEARCEAVHQGQKHKLLVAFEREDGHVSRSDLEILPLTPASISDTLKLVKIHVKFSLWARGARRVYMSGPQELIEPLRKDYASTGVRRFDADIMSRIYQSPFSVVSVAHSDIPTATRQHKSMGGHTKGCRIGFDLGASDYKLAAVIDGEPVFTEEIPWDPKNQPDPEYHVSHITTGLKKAAAHLPRVDAVGGSSAGIIVDSEIRVASLFRAVPPAAFQERVIPLFKTLANEWHVPFLVANDGDVTALAGAMSLGRGRILGIALGSSEAAGYIDSSGSITGWINELAFAPVDMNPDAPADEWSGDTGVGASYFSQQAIPRLANWAGVPVPIHLPLPEMLKAVQTLADAGDQSALRIFETIGYYLAETIPWYCRYYDVDCLMILGRVTSGRGGEILLATAREHLEAHYPEVARKVTVTLPDEKTRRLGQAVAAASLPPI